MRSSAAFKRNANKVVPIRRHRPMYQIALYMGLLLMLGLVVMYTLGPQRANVLNYAYGTHYDSNFFFNKQLASVIIAIAAFAACALLPLKWVNKYAKQIFLTGLILCLLLVVMGAILHLPIAKDTNGAYRWFYLGQLGSLQPSELLKYGVLVFLAGFLSKRVKQEKINDMQETLVPVAVLAGISLIVVVFLQKDLGTGMSLVAIIMAMLVVSGMNGKIIAKVLGAVLILGVLMIAMSPHRIERVVTFLQGDSRRSASQDDGDYHIQQARIAIGSGGLLGLGIGKSVQATGYLPEAINDSIFAVMGETFGFLGLVAILALFTALLLSILRVSARLPDMRLRLAAAGVFGWVASHVIMNIAAMTGVAPLTGIPLPLLSYGGTSMMFIAAALGLVFQISRYTSHKPLEEGSDGKNLSGRRRFGRTRYASGSRI